MVEDSLIGRPVSPILGVSVLNQLSVPLNDIEVQVVNVGDQEVSYFILWLVVVS